MSQPKAHGIKPPRNILNPEFQYSPAARTDVTRVWTRHGWNPPDREHQRKMMLRLNPITENSEWQPPTH